MFEEVQEHRTDLTGREKDLAIAEIGKYGPYWKDADPSAHPGARLSMRGSLELLKGYVDLAAETADGFDATIGELE